LKKAIPFPKKAAILSAVFHFFPDRLHFPEENALREYFEPPPKDRRIVFFSFFSGLRLIFPDFMV